MASTAQLRRSTLSLDAFHLRESLDSLYLPDENTSRTFASKVPSRLIRPSLRLGGHPGTRRLVAAEPLGYLVSTQHVCSRLSSTITAGARQLYVVSTILTRTVVARSLRMGCAATAPRGRRRRAEVGRDRHTCLLGEVADPLTRSVDSGQWGRRESEAST